MISNGYLWRSAPGVAEADLKDVLAAFPDVDRLRGARVIKENHFRKVVHVPAGGIPGAEYGLIAKVYRYTSLWDRLRYRFLRHRAAQELFALERFRELGLPTARGLAMAERREGGALAGGGLLVSFLGGTAPLVEALRDLPAPEASALLERTGKLVRNLHDRGVVHRDLHAGNILVGPGGALHLIDLHTCLFLRRLARGRRRAGLTKLVHSLSQTVSAEGLRSVIRAYGPDALVARGSLDAAEAEILRAAARLERRRVRSRSKRCFLPSTRFTAERDHGARIYRVRKWESEMLQPVFSRAPPGRVLKRTRRGWVAAVKVGDQDLCVKYRRSTWLEGIQSILESHRLRRAYGGGHALAVRGIPSPQVVALRERRVLGMIRESHLVTELVADASRLDDLLFREHWPPRREVARGARAKRILAVAVGRLLRALHDAGLYPHDLAPHNLLVAGAPFAECASSRQAWEDGSGLAPFLFLVDLDHLYLWQPLTRSGRLKNLAEAANFPEGHVSWTDRLRGLRAYARGDKRYAGKAWAADARRRVLREQWYVLLKESRKEARRETTASGAAFKPGDA